MKKSILIIAALLFGLSFTWADGRRVIAHKGYWNTEGAAENSFNALQKALDLGVYSSECDLRLSSDGKLFLNHDREINGLDIEKNPSSRVKQERLADGERITRLEPCLKALKKSKTRTKMLLEIKTDYTMKAAEEAVRLVKKYGVEDKVEYEAFSFEVCKTLFKNAPDAVVYYLKGDKSPREVRAAGFRGIDYHWNVILQHPEWVKEAHELGMLVSVWTLKTQQDIDARLQKFLDLGVDLITTDLPEECARLIP